MKVNYQKRHIRDIALGFWILLIPFILYAHKAFGDEETIWLFGKEYDHGFYSSEHFMWFILIKVVAILLLLTWFFVSSHWWKYFVFFPYWAYFYTLVDGFYFIPILSENTKLIAGITTIATIIIACVFDYCFLRKPSEIKLRPNDPTIEKKQYQRIKTKAEDLKKLKEGQSQQIYLYELFKLKQLLASFFFKSLNSKAQYLKKKLLLDLLICLVLMAMPFAYYTFKLIPKGVQEYALFGIVLGTKGFADVNVYVWYVSLKICILIPLCIWFVTSNQWWRYAILSPIILFAYQLWGAYQNETLEVDNYEYIKALPVILLLVVVLLVISKGIKYQAKTADIYETLTVEIDQLSSQMSTEKVADIKVKYDLEKSKPTEYLDNLIRLKKDLENELGGTI